MRFSYILDRQGNAVPEDDLEVWGKWFATDERRIVRHTPVPGGNDAYVSTVFLGMDHDFSGEGPPVLWETMTFGLPDGHPLAEIMVRYTSMSDAIAGHEVTVEMLREIHDGTFEILPTEETEEEPVRSSFFAKISDAR